jgi:hypothetical protein
MLAKQELLIFSKAGCAVCGLLKGVVALYHSWDELSGIYLDFKLVPGTVCLRLQSRSGIDEVPTIILFTEKGDCPERAYRPSARHGEPIRLLILTRKYSG